MKVEVEMLSEPDCARYMMSCYGLISEITDNPVGLG